MSRRIARLPASAFSDALPFRATAFESDRNFPSRTPHNRAGPGGSPSGEHDDMRFRQYINRLRKQPHPIICRSAGAGVSRPGTRTPKHSHKNPGSPAERGLAGHRPVRENVRPPCQRFPQGRKGLHSPKDVPRRDSPRRKTVPSRSVLFGTPTMSALPPLRRIVSVFLRAAVVRPRRLPFGFGGPQKTRPTKNVPQKSAAPYSGKRLRCRSRFPHGHPTARTPVHAVFAP